MAIIMMIRHGQNNTLGNTLAGRLPGVHLNEEGKVQAQLLAEELKDLPIKAVYASPLERTLETAEPIARIHNLPVKEFPYLLEIDFGEWQGVEMSNLKERTSWKSFHDDPAQMRFPGGENYTEAQTRIVQGMLQLGDQYGEKDLLVCVSHCDSIRLMVAYFLGMPLTNFHRINISPASITVLYLHEGKVSFGPINYTIEFPSLSK